MKELLNRSQHQCELCGAKNELNAYLVAPKTEDILANKVCVCATCKAQLNEEVALDENHWRCLNDAMWSEVPAVQVVSYGLLHRLQDKDWAQDLLNMLYLEDNTRQWAEEHLNLAEIVHKDSNGNVLQNGDKVVLTKTLNVKGSSVNASKGTVIHNIRLVPDNAEQIEGKIDGQLIVVLTQYLKKN